LGLTFLEINDRAYVRSVDAGSKAEKAGIQPRDCVQFALVVGGPQFEDLQSSRRRNTVGVGMAASTSPHHHHHHHHHHHGRGRNNNRDYYERENNEEEVLDAKATKFALECEKRGMRTSYNELRDLFAGCTLRPKGERAGVGGAGVGVGSGAKDKMESTLHLPSKTPSSRPNSTTPDDDFTIGSNSLILTDSVGGIFEHTKKSKEYISSRRVPLPDNKTAKNVTMNVTNAAMHVAGRCFDGDDGEASEFEEDHHQGATYGPKKSSPPLDTPMTPIKSNNLISTSSPGQSGANYGDGMLEQSLWPVVLVFRRTVQRKRMLSNNKWGSPGLSLRGSLFGIPSLRMDDECDRAAALIRQLAPRTKSQTGHAESDVFGTHDIDGDSINAPTVATATEHAGIDENIEASTIRGMIEAAVGLGFVRVSKVVVGVSLQHGSGIIISRLPDGTWSAPSALGVYGLGVGFQFGLEVADFMFIIQTNEGMEHFKNSGNFVVGGNIGAAVVNCGREAYGAASLGVGVCSGMLPLEEQNEQEDAENDHGDDDEKTYQSNKSNSHGIRRKKKGNDIAPMVAYAKSQGLYFGVSVDGLRFFTRNDINARTYKFSMLNDTSAKYILSGLVVPPPEVSLFHGS
jgi:lipid-binding SYLF domain-containing protein